MEKSPAELQESPVDSNNGAALLRAALASNGWTQTRAARELGVSATTMSRWINANRVPDREHMRVLRELFGISPEAWF